MNIGPNEDTIQSKEQMAEKYLTNYSNGEMSLAYMSGGIQKGPTMILQSSQGDSEKMPLSFGQKTNGPHCE